MIYLQVRQQGCRAHFGHGVCARGIRCVAAASRVASACRRLRAQMRELWLSEVGCNVPRSIVQRCVSAGVVRGSLPFRVLPPLVELQNGASCPYVRWVQFFGLGSIFYLGEDGDIWGFVVKALDLKKIFTPVFRAGRSGSGPAIVDAMGRAGNGQGTGVGAQPPGMLGSPGWTWFQRGPMKRRQPAVTTL